MEMKNFIILLSCLAKIYALTIQIPNDYSTIQEDGTAEIDLHFSQYKTPYSWGFYFKSKIGST